MLRLDQHMQIQVGESVELPLSLRASEHEKLWLTRGDRWVPTVVSGPGKTRYLQITNVSEKKLVLQRDERIGIGLAGDHTTNPTAVVKGVSTIDTPDTNAAKTGSRSADPQDSSSDSSSADQGKDMYSEPDPVNQMGPPDPDPEADQQICYHESGDLYAEDVQDEMAVLLEVTLTTDEVTIEDIQVGDPEINAPEQIDRLVRQDLTALAGTVPYVTQMFAILPRQSKLLQPIYSELCYLPGGTYELREVDFAAMDKISRSTSIDGQIRSCIQDPTELDIAKHDMLTDDLTGVDPRWSRAYKAFRR
ncbi:unnamed protein product [Phytophthora lilii]|uniref:Unnamed protein product n=1 Tax=Phytophthora lilii TaxID=2077276 RepID=A0A9W6TY74_9STRA|nr:unnamed protein product [Phytophthora lilii]